MSSTAEIAVAELGGKVAQFNPAATRGRLSQADAVIAHCATMKEWEALDHAVGIKIEEQASFIAWWDATVRRKGGEGGYSDNADRGYRLSVDAAEEQTGITQQQVSKWRKALTDRDKYFSKIVVSACRAAGLEPPENHRAEGTGDNEWFTPARYIEAARAAMGGIDLDPATHPIAQQTIRAEHFFTQADDGLKREWHGRVWMNPPYTQPHIEQFVNKLVYEVEAGRVTQAIALTHNYTDTAWFHAAERYARLICFTKGRIAFVDAEGGTCAPTQGQAFFYFTQGDNCRAFVDEFRAFGFIR